MYNLRLKYYLDKEVFFFKQIYISGINIVFKISLFSVETGYNDPDCIVTITDEDVDRVTSYPECTSLEFHFGAAVKSIHKLVEKARHASLLSPLDMDGLGVEIFGNVGDEFDPNLHNAVMHIENEDLPENSLAAVFQKGFKIGDKVVRFAMVQVAN